MSTILLILSIAFFGYVAYMMFFFKSDSVGVLSQTESQPVQSEKTSEPGDEALSDDNAATPQPTGYKHPKTGDTAAVPSGYRFAKRWIKEALVTEGLLDKIYKNNELDDAANAKVKEALERFKELSKYHA